MQKVLVLGGYGFLGSHVVSELKKRNYKATCASRRNGCDILKLSSFENFLVRTHPEAIINCAAHVGSVHYLQRFAADVVYENMQMILNLYQGVLEVNPKIKVINPISNCSYPGEANTHVEPDWQKGPVHDSVLAYASTRRMIHAVSKCFQNQHQIKSVNWFISNAYGPGDYTDPNKVHALNGIIIRLIQAQRKKDKQFEIWGSGKPLREWVYVKDVAKILVQSLKIDMQIYPVNFAQNKAYSIAEIADTATRSLGYKLNFTYNTKLTDGAMYKILDDKNFRSKYPDFKFTPILQGIKNTIAYYKEVLSV